MVLTIHQATIFMCFFLFIFLSIAQFTLIENLLSTPCSGGTAGFSGEAVELESSPPKIVKSGQSLNSYICNCVEKAYA